MTVVLSGEEIAVRLEGEFPGSIVESSPSKLVIKSEFLLAAATFLKVTPDLDFDYLTAITAVDYYDYFEVVYQLTSLGHNHTLMLKTRYYEDIIMHQPISLHWRMYFLRYEIILPN